MPIRVTRQPTAEAIGGMALQIGRGRAAQTAADRAEMIRQFEETLGEQKREFDVGTKMRMAQASLDFRMFERSMEEAATARREGYGFAREQAERGIAASAEQQMRSINARIEETKKAYDQAMELAQMGDVRGRDIANQNDARLRDLYAEQERALWDRLQETQRFTQERDETKAGQNFMGTLMQWDAARSEHYQRRGFTYSPAQVTERARLFKNVTAYMQPGTPVTFREALQAVMQGVNGLGAIIPGQPVGPTVKDMVTKGTDMYRTPDGGMWYRAGPGLLRYAAPKADLNKLTAEQERKFTIEDAKLKMDRIAGEKKARLDETMSFYRLKSLTLKVPTPDGTGTVEQPMFESDADIWRVIREGAPAAAPPFDLGQWLGGILGMGGEGAGEAPAAPPSAEALAGFREIANTPGHPHRATAQAILDRWSK